MKRFAGYIVLLFIRQSNRCSFLLDRLQFLQCWQRYMELFSDQSLVSNLSGSGIPSRSIINPAILIAGLIILSFEVNADDTDIFLEQDSTANQSHYLMLMIDYSPETFDVYCESISSCIPRMTVNAFMALCSRHAFADDANASLSAKRSVCRQYYYAHGGN